MKYIYWWIGIIFIFSGFFFDKWILSVAGVFFIFCYFEERL